MNQRNDNGFHAFLQQCRDAVREQGAGNTEPFHQMWSHTDDVVLMGAAGAHQVGWADIDSHLTETSQHLHYTQWSFTNLMTRVEGDLAVTLDLEQMSAPELKPPLKRTLRVTQIYQRTTDGWRLIARHGDPLDQPISLEPVATRSDGSAARTGDI